MNTYSRFVNWARGQGWGYSIRNRLRSMINNDKILDFFKNILKLFIYNRSASVFYMVLSIIIARVLGPTELGQMSLAGNISSFMVIPVMVGSYAIYKYLPGTNRKRGDELISVVLLGNLVLTVLFTLLFRFGYAFTKGLGISLSIWNIGLLVTNATSWYALIESFLRGREKYDLIGKLKFICSVISCGTTLFLIYIFQWKSFGSYFYGIVIANFFFIIIGMLRLRIDAFYFSWDTVREVYSYGFIVALNTLLTTILCSSDLFFVNYFHKGYTVGIYSAYTGYVKNLFMVAFNEVFSVVFFPTIANMDKFNLYKKVNRYVPIILPVFIIGAGVLLSLTLLLIGKEYEFNILYILLTCIGPGVFIIFQIYTSILSLEGKQGARLCFIPQGIVLPISLAAQFYFTKIWGIAGTMISIAVTNVLLVVILHFLIHYHFKARSTAFAK